MSYMLNDSSAALYDCKFNRTNKNVLTIVQHFNVNKSLRNGYNDVKSK